MSLASPRTATPGPGTWLVDDLDNRLTVTGGKLVISGASPTWNRTSLLLQTPFARHRGRYLEAQFTPDSADQDMQVTWQNAPSGDLEHTEVGLRFGPDSFVTAVDGPGLFIPTQYPYSADTSYAVRLYDGGPAVLTASSNGAGDLLCYIRVTTSPKWTLLWRKPASSGNYTQLYAGMNNIAHTGSMDYVRVRNARLLEIWGFVALPVDHERLCALAEGIAEVMIEAPASGTAELVFRMTDEQHYFSFVLDVTNQRIYLNKTVAGVTSLVGARPVTIRPFKLYVLRALCYDDTVTTFLGRTPGPLTGDSFNATDGLICGYNGTANALNLRFDAGGEQLW